MEFKFEFPLGGGSGDGGSRPGPGHPHPHPQGPAPAAARRPRLREHVVGDPTDLRPLLERAAVSVLEAGGLRIEHIEPSALLRPGAEVEGPGPGPGAGPGAGAGPEEGEGPGPEASRPRPHDGEGPGPQEVGSGAEEGEGPGPEEGEGPGPEASRPGPHDGEGPGPQEVGSEDGGPGPEEGPGPGPEASRPGPHDGEGPGPQEVGSGAEDGGPGPEEGPGPGPGPGGLPWDALSHSDLVPGLYEGGLKVWECTADLLDYLAGVELRGLRVLDLGCGAGLLGIAALGKGAACVHFQDYNAEVLERLTIPNVALLGPGPAGDDGPPGKRSRAGGSPLSRCRFFSGPWSLFARVHGAPFKYDAILSSETLYNPGSYAELHRALARLLSDRGTVYLATKAHYFGVGGGIHLFQSFVREKQVFDLRTVKVIDDGLQRCIALMSFRREGSP